MSIDFCRRPRQAVLLSIAICIPCAAEDASDFSPEHAFHQEALLKRFDKNSSGQLELEERKTIRAAYGGIDIPMLPSKSYPYRLDASLIEHVDKSKLKQTDNTPADNPVSNTGATLGRVLFYDKQLSKNNSIACASCHHQQFGFSDPAKLSVGFEGGRTKRNAMSLANLRYSNFNGARAGFFWDERAATLEDQVLMPIQDHVEMGMKLEDLEKKLQALPYYPLLFHAAFGSPKVDRVRIAKAVAQFMRSMVSFNSKFDQAARAAKSLDYVEDFEDFSNAENLGKSLFMNGVDGIAEIGCAHCHIPPTFAMPKSFNNGLDLKYSDPGLGARDVPANDPFSPSNDGKFKSSPLRNIELTGPYMHDGRFQTLEQVIEHYSNAVHPHENLGIAFAEGGQLTAQGTSGFQLTDTQKAALLAFLKTLTDKEFISDPRFSDPFVRLPVDQGKVD